MFLLWNGRRFDVWHVHQYGAHAALAALLGLILRRPVILKLTSSGRQGLATIIRSGRFVSLSAFLLRKVCAVISTTRETAWEAEACGFTREQIFTLGNGIDISCFLPLDAAEKSRLKRLLGLGESRIVLFVGRLSEEKSPDGLLQAWEVALASLSDDWMLVVVGDGPMRTQIESMVRDRSLASRVLIAGQQENIAQWMGTADLYVLCSKNEGLSNTILEAMACGLPVVATRVSGVRELVEETGSGLAVDILDMGGLARALVQLACDAPLRTRMGATGRAVIEERYAIESVAAGHEALYCRLIVAGKC
jgi:glycosyltransferase involved in cell wall biosynthesis